MFLKEDYGNLKVLDRSLLFYNDNKNVDDNDEIMLKNVRKSVNLKNTGISPNSKVEIDPVKPHTMKHIIEILDEHNVAAIVFRINHKQICLITSSEIYNTTQTGQDIFVKPSAFASINLDFGINSVNSHSAYPFREAILKRKLSELVKIFQEKFKLEKKPTWDILVIYKDEEVVNKWIQRDKSKEGYIPTPKEKEKYKLFLLDFQNALNEKRKKWVESHRKDAQNIDELKELLYKQCNIGKIKFKGNDYFIQDAGRTFLYTNDAQYLKYVHEDEKIPVQSLLIKYKVIGLNIKILGIYYSEKYSTNNLDDYKPLV